MKVKVTIDRGNGREVFEGTVIDETSSFYKVVSKHNDRGEMFSKNSPSVSCEVIL